MYKHFGLLATILLIFGLSFVVKKWPYGINRTFSQHIARNKTAIVYYVALFSVAMPLLLLFFIKWFIPEFNLPALFTSLIITSSLAQLGCTLVPETGSAKSTTHRLLAFVSAFCLLPALFIIILTSSVSLSGKIISALGCVVMLGIIAILVRNKAEHRYLLLLQSAYFLVFFTTILVVTYDA